MIRYWDINNQMILSPTIGNLNSLTFLDTLIAHAILASLTANNVWQWKDPVTNTLEGSLLVQSSGNFPHFSHITQHCAYVIL